MLTDSFGRVHDYLRISVTDRCNFNCFYCKPYSKFGWNKKENILSFEEIIKLVEIFSSLGIKKVRITGGEPLLRKDIESLIKNISQRRLAERIGITTNGYFLEEKAEALKKSGLDSVNVSLDSLSPRNFKCISKTDALNRVLPGIERAIELGFEEVKINMVVIRGVNDDEILDFVEFFKNKNVHLRFIEFMPFFNNGWEKDKFLPNEIVRTIISRQYELLPVDDGGTVAKNYRLDGLKSIIGFISPNSFPFCNGCSRLRLTSDGKLRLCLFSSEEFDLRHLLKMKVNDEVLREYIQQCLGAKKFTARETYNLEKQSSVIMTSVGG